MIRTKVWETVTEKLESGVEAIIYFLTKKKNKKILFQINAKSQEYCILSEVKKAINIRILYVTQ